MVLSTATIDWAVRELVNGLEIDIVFDHQQRADGEGADHQRCYHGPICDCTCLTYLFERHLCASEADGGGGFPSSCELGSDLEAIYRHIGSVHGDLAMLHLDNKMGDDRASAWWTDEGYKGHKSDKDMEATGSHNARWYTDYCVNSGFGGDVTVGGYADVDTPSFFIGSINHMQGRGLVGTMWIAWECYRNGKNIEIWNFEEGFKILHGKVSVHDYKSARCDGITACVHWAMDKVDSVKADVAGRVAGQTDRVIIWTVDKYDLMDEYLVLTVDAIMTNRPRLMHDVYKKFAWFRTYPGTDLPGV